MTLRSTGRGAESSAEFHDLEFGLSLREGGSQDPEADDTDNVDSSGSLGKIKSLASSNLFQRTNVARFDERSHAHGDLWKYVPGDLVATWKSNYFDTRNRDATERQLEERNFYVPCARCKRTISQIKAEGPVDGCRGSCGLDPSKARADSFQQSSPPYREV